MNKFTSRWFRGVAVTGTALTTSAALHAAPSCAQEPVAIFAGDGLEVVIEATGPEGRALRGRLHHLGEQYPFRATTHADFGRSDGTFQVGEDRYGFELLPTDDVNTLRLVTRDPAYQNETVYDLRRREAVPVAVPASVGEAKGAAHRAVHDTTSSPVEAHATPAASAPVGLTLRQHGGGEGGWEVTAVDPGSRAEHAGFAPGDVITAARAGNGEGVNMPLYDRDALVVALTDPGIYLTTARAGRADHTVVLYPAIPASAPRAEVGKYAESERAKASDIQGAQTTAMPAAPVPTSLLTLEPAGAIDDVVTGLMSHTLLLPQGWALDAQVLWTPAVDAAFVNMNARATSPDGGQQVTWLPDGAFTDAAGAGADSDAAFGSIVQGKVRFPRMGAAADFIQNAVLPGFRPEATGVRVLSADVSPGVADAWERHHETFLTAQKKHLSALHARKAGATDASPTTARVTAPQVRLSYDDHGSAYEEAFTFVHLELTTPTDSGPVHDWFVFAVSALRAPAGELDRATPTLRAVAESLRPTQRWQAVIEALTPELTRAQPPMTSDQVVALARPMLNDLDLLVAAHSRGWSALRAANAARIEAFAAVIPGLTLVHSSDGAAQRVLPLGDGLRAVINPRGAVLLTDDAPAADAARPDGPWQDVQ